MHNANFLFPDAPLTQAEVSDCVSPEGFETR